MNIYTLSGEHIGKRYAAGIWCWDCKVLVGLGRKCLQCGNEACEIKFNSAFRELGFDKSEPKKHKGIDGASGFSWQGKSVDEAKKKLNRKRFVITEYGDKWTIEKFWKMFDDILPQKAYDREFS